MQRYDEICSLLRPFLLQSGFQPQKTKFVPVSAILGVNLAARSGKAAEQLNQWYRGATLVDLFGLYLFSISYAHLKVNSFH
jgi:elongation factor 1 alpha-like protein